MTREQLKKYRTLKAELDDLEVEISSKILHDSVQKSKQEFPYTFGHEHIEGVADEDHDLLLRKSDLKAQIREIESFVNGIEDYNLKKAIQIYYMNSIDESGERKKWEDIADEFNDGSTANSIKMAVSRYLNKNL